MWEVFGTDSFSVRPRRKTFLVGFVAKGMVMVTSLESVLFPPFNMFGIFLNSLILFLGIAATGLVVCFGMVGCLVLVASVIRTPGLPPLVIWLLFSLNGALVLIRLTLLVAGLLREYWDAADTALEMSEYLNIWTDGSTEDFSSVGGFEVAGAGVHLPASELAFEGSVWGVAEEYGDARLERCRAFMPVPGVMQTVQRAEFSGCIIAMQAYWPCHLGVDNLNVARSFGRLLDHDSLVKISAFG